MLTGDCTHDLTETPTRRLISFFSLSGDADSSGVVLHIHVVFPQWFKPCGIGLTRAFGKNQRFYEDRVEA